MKNEYAKLKNKKGQYKTKKEFPKIIQESITCIPKKEYDFVDWNEFLENFDTDVDNNFNYLKYVLNNQYVIGSLRKPDEIIENLHKKILNYLISSRLNKENERDYNSYSNYDFFIDGVFAQLINSTLLYFEKRGTLELHKDDILCLKTIRPSLYNSLNERFFVNYPLVKDEIKIGVKEAIVRTKDYSSYDSETIDLPIIFNKTVGIDDLFELLDTLILAVKNLKAADYPNFNRMLYTTIYKIINCYSNLIVAFFNKTNDTDELKEIFKKVGFDYLSKMLESISKTYSIFSFNSKKSLIIEVISRTYCYFTSLNYNQRDLESFSNFCLSLLKKYEIGISSDLFSCLGGKGLLISDVVNPIGERVNYNDVALLQMDCTVLDIFSNASFSECEDYIKNSVNSETPLCDISQFKNRLIARFDNQDFEMNLDNNLYKINLLIDNLKSKSA